ncbi:MAG: SPOR domain-containing protein [Candidatus Kapaibacterium sp.]
MEILTGRIFTAMIDEKDLDSPTDNDGFADESSDNGAFRLESLERYPDAVPFEFDDEADEPAGNSDDSTQLPPATLAAIKSDLDKGRRRKAKPDTLALSLDRLRKVLHTTSPEVAEFTLESDPLLVDPLAGKPEISSTDITISERPVITERKPVKPSDDGSSLDLDAGDSSQASTKADKSSKKASSSSAKDSSKKKRRALPVIPIIIGVGFLVASVGGYLAYRAISTKPGQVSGGNGSAESTATKKNGISDPTMAEKTATEKTVAEEAPAEASAESRLETSTQSETLAQDAVQSPAQPDATGQSETSHQVAPSSRSSEQTSTSSVSSKQTSTHNIRAGAAAPTGSSGSHSTAHGAESVRQAIAQHSHQTSKQIAKQTEHTVLRPKVSAPKDQHKHNSGTTGSAHASAHESAHATPVASVSKKTTSATLPAAKTSPRESSKAANSTPTEHSTSALSVAKSESGVNQKTSSRVDIIPAPHMNLKSVNRSMAQFSVHVFSTFYRQDAERRLQLLQGRSISGGYITEQQVRGRTVYNVRFGIFRTKEDAEAALIRHAVSGGSICRLR